MAMDGMNGNEMKEGFKKSGKKVGIIVILVLILVVASMLFGRSCGKKAAQKQLDQKEEEVKTWQDLYYGELDEVNQARDDLSAAKEEIEKLKAGGAVPAQDTSADEAAAEVAADDGEAVDAGVDATADAGEDAAADVSGDAASDASGDAASEEAGDEKNATGISPDLKAFLDSYENYMDEYVEFLKKYNSDSANALTMIGEYTQMLAKYEDFADKADKYNEDNLNAEEWKYYMEVINRVNQKLMSVY